MQTSSAEDRYLRFVGKSPVIIPEEITETQLSIKPAISTVNSLFNDRAFSLSLSSFNNLVPLPGLASNLNSLPCLLQSIPNRVCPASARKRWLRDPTCLPSTDLTTKISTTPECTIQTLSSSSSMKGLLPSSSRGVPSFNKIFFSFSIIKRMFVL